jgi:diguanylate cyclase (GGDEF)-like protein
VTGLPDRSVFQRDLLAQFADEESLAVVLVGVDGMRELNREGGPGSGDAALARASEAVARATREACGENAVVHRFVGAELALIVRGEAVDRTDSLAERLRAAVRLSPFSDESLGLRSLGVSVGVATRSGAIGPTSPDELLRAAMMALSEARRTGGDAIVAWQDGEPVSIAA